MKRLLLFATLLALGLGAAHAQELTTGTLEGVVRGDDGNPIGDALVTVKGPQGSKTTTTDSKGRYVARGLIPGTYQVRAEAPGYAAMIQNDVEIFINQKTQLPFTLNAGMTEEVTVISQAPIVDLKSTTTGETVKIDDFAPYVPLGRNLVSVMAIAPGVSDGGTVGVYNQSISGSSGLENAYFIDGVNVTDSGFGALGSYSIIYGSLGTGVTYDFLEEVQIKTAGFTAEYGQAGGGVVNTVVKSGTNQFNLDFSWYETPGGLEGTRNDRFDDPSWANEVEATRRDIALSVGGPMVRDKLFYFAAYNPVTTKTNFKLTSGNALNPYYLEDNDGSNDGLICDGSDSCFDISGGDTINSPVSPVDDPLFYKIGQTVKDGRVPDAVTRERRNDNYAVKLSWFATPNHKIELTGFGDPSTSDVGPQDPTGFLRNLARPIEVPDPAAGATGLDYGGNSISLKYQGVWTSNFFTELLVARKESEFTEFGPGTEARAYSIPSANINLGGVGYYETRLDEVTQVSLKNTHVLGPVELRYSIQYDDMEYMSPANRSGESTTAYYAMVDDVDVDRDSDGVADDDPGLGFTQGCTNGGAFGNPVCYQPVQTVTGANAEIWEGDANGDGTPDPGELLYAAYGSLNARDEMTTNAEVNVFAQVSWDVISNLTLKAGLRWTEQKIRGSGEFSLPIGATSIRELPTGIGSTDYSPLAYRFDSEIAPRLGISWDVRNNGKHKLYANYGQYNQRVPNDLAVRMFSSGVGMGGQSGTPFQDIDLTLPALENNACWLDADTDGLFDTQIDCHIARRDVESPAVILDGTQHEEGSAVYDHLGPDVVYTSADSTRLPMTEEWLLGYAWEVNDFTGVEVRWINRELGRVLEDIQFSSNEQIWNQFRGGRLFDAYNREVFSGHGSGSFGSYVLANVGGNVDTTLFPLPFRDYQSLEFVFNRRFKAGWMAYANYRYSELEGNYEGSYRNDNAQSDPFITSLFDLPAASGFVDVDTDGNVTSRDYVESGTLEGQFTNGPLNTDRTHILNAFLSKQFDFGLNLGLRSTFRTGQPRFPLFAHPTYRNSGEIPGVNPTYWYLVAVDGSTGESAEGLLFDHDAGFSPGDEAPIQDYDLDGIADGGPGNVPIVTDGPRLYAYDLVNRDVWGRNPATLTFDVHASYDFALRGGKSRLTLLLDVFNLFNENGSLTFDNDIETRPGNPNPDYLKPNLFHQPRYIRLGLRFTY